MRNTARAPLHFTGLVMAAFFVGGVNSAVASGSPFGGPAAKTIYLSSGANVGAGTSLDGRGTGLLLGAEASVFDTKGVKPNFTLVPQGIFLDALHDSRSESWRFSMGPELVAYPFVGFDLGLVIERSPDNVEFGARFRYFVPFILVMPYLGVTVVGSGCCPALESGALIKLPLILYER